MLVPAMAFAWWVVSMSTPAARAEARPAGGAERSRPAVVAQGTAEIAPSAEAPEDDRQGQRQDSEDQGSVADLTDPPPSPETSAEPGNQGRRVAVKWVTPEIVRMAKTFLDLPMGAERPVDIEGKRYVFVLERHYHPPGFVGGPTGYHKGVTVYEFR
jgi:hypothetical protein